MDNQNVPLVSVITPSFNQGRFIRETIESVLTQSYKNLEHIVIDGGSTDGTLQILKEYEQRDPRFRFVSKPDNGQSHAINKGLKMAKGKIIGWLNSDDTYLPKAVSHAVEAFTNHPNWKMVYGNAYYTNKNNERLRPFIAKPVQLKELFNSCPICQPSVFIQKETLDEIGGIDESLDFCMDYDLWIRIAKNGYEMGILKDHYLANARFYPESKSGSKFADVGFPEIIKTSKNHFGTVSSSWLNLFLKGYREKGVFWFLTLFRTSSLFGNSPKITETNLDKNSWASYHLKVSINTYPQKPLHAIIIKGNLKKFHKLPCNAFLNGRVIQKIKLNRGSFILQIPVYSHKPLNFFELTCDTNVSNHSGAPLYQITDILPLTKDEYNFFIEFEKGNANVRKWIDLAFKQHPPNLEE
ncbi:glycosyltransferase [Bacillus sp. V3B]|uniref:glycosyltransferase family 2 protein n=1 Tax=Bacillus sp. V3B TaxID=2804915 RepID=UPI0021089006|nr:glycosyltransferase family 2 protein [Bacillus sp. V3B]MCQ6274863.1 glycosyltransferase [Bacillus sp. V3B]